MNTITISTVYSINVNVITYILLRYYYYYYSISTFTLYLGWFVVCCMLNTVDLCPCYSPLPYSSFILITHNSIDTRSYIHLFWHDILRMAYIRVTLYIYTNGLRFTFCIRPLPLSLPLSFPSSVPFIPYVISFGLKLLSRHTQKGNTTQHKTRHKQHEVNDKGAYKGTEKDKETKTKRRR